MGEFHAEHLAFAVLGEEAGGNDAGVVQHDEISWGEVGGEIGEGFVLDESGLAMDHHHAGSAALGERLASDEFWGEVVIEIGREHRVRVGAGGLG